MPGKLTVLHAQTVQPFFFFRFLAPQSEELILLPDIPHAGAADKKADDHGFQGRSETDRRRLVRSSSLHAKFFPSPAVARSALAGLPRFRPGSAEPPAGSPISSLEQPARAVRVRPRCP